jgi:acyl-CoA reductase-like NAD-dependent aldehyde dehydrogenase
VIAAEKSGEERILQDYRLWIDGQWQASAGGGRLTIVDPATEQPIASVIDGSRADVDRAVQAASRAFYDGRWSKKTPGERSKALWKLADLIESNAERLARAGAKVLLGGQAPADRDAGYYFAPTVIADADQKSEIIQSEVFGPVLTISSFSDDADAVRLGNDVLYGLAVSVFTKDVGRAMTVSSQLEFGTVWINDHIPLTSETPHGGFKQSGFGRDLSAEAMSDYQITKHVMIAQ